MMWDHTTPLKKRQQKKKQEKAYPNIDFRCKTETSPSRHRHRTLKKKNIIKKIKKKPRQVLNTKTIGATLSWRVQQKQDAVSEQREYRNPSTNPTRHAHNLSNMAQCKIQPKHKQTSKQKNTWQELLLVAFLAGDPSSTSVTYCLWDYNNVDTTTPIIY